VLQGTGVVTIVGELVTARVDAGCPLLEAMDVEAALVKLNLMPLQVAHLAGTQTVATSWRRGGRGGYKLN
jgi:hypothetical protein